MMIDRSTAVSTTRRRRMPPAGWSLFPQPSDPGPGPSITESEAGEEGEPSGEAGGEITPATEGEGALPVTGSKN
jgi:hypothetical protein